MIDAKDIATIAALLLGPAIAVIITVVMQRRSEKKATKTRLFVSLMGHRRSIPISQEWATSLNLIDVVYADRPKVVACWHRVYDILQTAPLHMERYNHAYLELMSEMAKSLRYRSLSQTDIDKFYIPEAHTLLANRQAEFLAEFVRVLKATERMGPERDEKSTAGKTQ